ncbi:alpha/beta fold hydrolase [Streptomyces chrestomyceticus]|uniref:alpha/beta fold hydrolase n=1 Tax=Streptomyces chrestomyceticus TaxID=68185 RepID=UPI0037BACB4B
MASEKCYVLIPGAGGVPWLWHRVAAELRHHGHDVVAVDLPNDDPAAGLAEYADAVVRAARGRTGVVLIAHSLGGFTAPLVCGRIPVERMVLVAAMPPAPGEWWENTGHGAAPAERERLGIEPEEMDGGHVPLLSRPRELAERVMRLSGG